MFQKYDSIMLLLVYNLFMTTDYSLFRYYICLTVFDYLSIVVFILYLL